MLCVRSQRNPGTSLTQCLWLLPALFTPPPTLNLSLPGGRLCFLPPASDPHNTNHSHLILVSWSSLCSLSLLFLSHSPPLSLLSWPGLFCWTRSVWIFPDAFACALPLIYNKLSLPYTGAGTSSFSHSVLSHSHGVQKLTWCAEQSDSEAEGEWERGSEKLVSDRTVLVWGDELLGANGRLTVCMYLLPLNHTHLRGAKMLTFVLCTLFHTDRKRQLCSGKEHREDNLLYGTGPLFF